MFHVRTTITGALHASHASDHLLAAVTEGMKVTTNLVADVGEHLLLTAPDDASRYE